MPEGTKETLDKIVSDLIASAAMINEHYLPRSHLSPQRAKKIAAELLDMYVAVSGGL